MDFRPIFFERCSSGDGEPEVGDAALSGEETHAACHWDCTVFALHWVWNNLK